MRIRVVAATAVWGSRSERHGNAIADRYSCCATFFGIPRCPSTRTQGRSLEGLPDSEGTSVGCQSSNPPGRISTDSLESFRIIGNLYQTRHLQFTIK